MTDLTHAHKKIPRVSPASCPSVYSLFFGGMWLLLGFLAILGSMCTSIIIYLLKMFSPKDPKGKEPDVNNEETTHNKEETKSIDMETDSKKEGKTSNKEEKKCVDMDTDAKNEDKTPKEKEKNPGENETTFNEEEKNVDMDTDDKMKKDKRKEKNQARRQMS
ncbi:uncharacterized protein LOC124441725 [Xenia sp. Carnegie-2017]|uniref:uncharacterized protein LOC124441725 n=1 Tax=Xenia sp. Carnegie-2017 TaxID=2897299 RepID=UPI001F037C64|nr:uncharacterized protein LOC124441725 [Xenia sp. Carnegie-2017]